MNQFDRRQLRYFIAVAEELHFGRAALRLHMSQPPLSQQIAALEVDLGVQLFKRTKRKVEITEAGQQFLQDARGILEAMDQAARQAKAAASGQTGTLHIGLNYSAPFSPHIPAIFKKFSTLYPDIRLELHENTSAKQLDGLFHHTLDLCFIWQTRDDVSPDIQSLGLGKSPLHLTVSTQSPLARKSRLHIDDLKGQTIFLTLRQTRTDFYHALVTACQSQGFEPTIRTDIIQLPFIMTMVAAGQGIGFLPTFFTALHPAGTLFRACSFLPKGADGMPLALAYRKSDISAAVRNFVMATKGYLKITG